VASNSCLRLMMVGGGLWPTQFVFPADDVVASPRGMAMIKEAAAADLILDGDALACGRVRPFACAFDTTRLTASVTT
jgi:hypothetical protein